MPELPDVVLYIEHLTARVLDQPLLRVRLDTPFLVRSVDPPLTEAVGRRVVGLRRVGKRIVFELEGELFLVFHLMIAGRFHWRPPGARVPGKVGLAAFEFPTGTLMLTEASSKKRASLHVVRGAAAVAAFDAGGLEVLDADLGAFRAALTRESHTLKRTLTDPRLLSGIGNAYGDEILHRARLSPVRLTRQLDDDEIARLYRATQDTLRGWIEQLRREAGNKFPERVTAGRAASTSSTRRFVHRAREPRRRGGNRDHRARRGRTCDAHRRAAVRGSAAGGMTDLLSRSSGTRP